MKIYDISQELLSCAVYSGDPTPKSHLVKSIADGELYNLTEISMCVHNGTHIDAPRHFLATGNDVSGIPLEKFVGAAYVVSCEGDITASVANVILSQAREVGIEPSRRILFKGNATLTEDGARVLAESGIYLVGTESQSVGDESSPMAVHLILLQHGVVLLEGLRLGAVHTGKYFLAAQPINIKNSDGAPTRAILIDGIV